MAFEIPQEIKDQLRTNRLKQLQAQWYTLEMDRISCVATGDAEGEALYVKRQKDVEKAYDAVNKMDDAANTDTTQTGGA